MSASTLITLVFSIIALSFAAWVIKQELSFKKVVRKDVKIETFLEEWIEKWLPKMKNEFMSKLGPYYIGALNGHFKLMEEKLLNNSNADVKIKISADVDFKKKADKLYEVFTKSSIIGRIHFARLENPVYNPHFILIDGKHLLISTTDDDGKVKEMISFTRNRKKASQFRNNFNKDFDDLPKINLKTI